MHFLFLIISYRVCGALATLQAGPAAYAVILVIIARMII
jgi:hypothetical protein